jgi:GNAT superfamily N-acetyltransferase
MGLMIEVRDEKDLPEADLVLAGLIAGNAPHLGPADFRDLAVLAHEGTTFVGGLTGETGRGVLYVDQFWVDPGRRGQGLGGRLLAAAEAEAAARGCRMAWLDTYDFQARPFYERHGYTVFGELDGFSNGHKRFFMKKNLAISPPAASPGT